MHLVDLDFTTQVQMTNWLEKFIQERRYLKNVTPKTEQYYRDSWNSFLKYTGSDSLTKSKLVEWVVEMRKAGVKPVSCNTFISGVNAFCALLFKQGLLPEPLKIKKLKVEQTVLKPIDESVIKAIASF